VCVTLLYIVPIIEHPRDVSVTRKKSSKLDEVCETRERKESWVNIGFCGTAGDSVLARTVLASTESASLEYLTTSQCLIVRLGLARESGEVYPRRPQIKTKKPASTPTLNHSHTTTAQ